MSVTLHPLSDADERRLATLLQQGELFPVLNDTKWVELIEEMQAAGDIHPEFRLKSVFAAQGFVTAWDGEWHYHIHPVAEIEWLEIRCDFPAWLTNVLHKHTIPFSIEEGILRVWGYTRPGVQPCWR